MSRAIIDALVERSAEALLQAACDHDEHGYADLGRYLLRAATTADKRSLVDFSVRLDRPVIGLGAPALAYYPEVATRLGTRAVVPEHAGSRTRWEPWWVGSGFRRPGRSPCPATDCIACSRGPVRETSRSGGGHGPRETPSGSLGPAGRDRRRRRRGESVVRTPRQRGRRGGSRDAGGEHGRRGRVGPPALRRRLTVRRTGIRLSDRVDVVSGLPPCRATTRQSDRPSHALCERTMNRS